MKNNLILLCYILLLFPAVSCSKQETPEQDTLSITISDIVYSNGSLDFVLKSSGASSIYFGVSEPDEHAVISVKAEVVPEQTIRVNNIVPGHRYEIAAMAVSENNQVSATETFFSEEEYSGPAYRKKVLISKFTGTWCGYCPQMTTILNELSYEYPEQLIITALHGGDGFECRATEILSLKFGVNSYPTAVIDYDHKSTQDKTMLSSSIDKALSCPAVAGLGISSTSTDTSVEIRIETEFGITGEYKICCLLMEDSLYEANSIGSDDKYYNHVVRTFATDPLGDYLGVFSNGESRIFNFRIERADYWNISNCHIAAYLLYRNNNGDYTVTNSTSAPVGESTDIEILN